MAPPPLKAALKYVFADLDEQGYTPTFEPVKMTPAVTVPERELTEDEEDIREALRFDRVDFKKVVAFGVESVRSEYNDDNNLKEDPITFSEQMDALPTGLGYAILCKQDTDEGWKWEMRTYALANLPD